ncbi:MAG: DUF1761 domain-containing protein [Saprospiraceae bacterium]
MEDLNFLPILVAALIPTITGMLWYGPLFKNQWIKSTGKTEEELMEGFKMPLVMGFSLVGSFFISFIVNATIELTHKTVEAGELIYGSHHTFGHGMLHGSFFALFLVGPILIMNGLYERKPWSNILIHLGYWVLTIGLIGGLTDAWN